MLAFYYKPDPDSAYQSIQFITNDLTLLARSAVCTRGASVFIILMFFHMARVFLFGLQVPARAELDHRRAPARDGDVEGFTGYPLPWDHDRVLGDGRRDHLERDGAGARALPGAVPLGGAEIGSDTLSKFYALHMLVILGRSSV